MIKIDDMIKKRNFVFILLSILLLLCIGIGITYAYMGSAIGEMNNVFTPSENIRAKLREPNWDADEGLKMVPGKTVNKDPLIVNTGQVDEYAAIRLTFQDKNETASLSKADLIKLLNLLEITWNSNWVLCEGSMVKDGTGKITDIVQPLIFYYNKVLTPGAVSDPIFSSVRVKTGTEGLIEADLRWLQGIKIVNGVIVQDTAGLGGFYIKAEGVAIQAQGYTSVASAASDLKALFP